MLLEVEFICILGVAIMNVLIAISVIIFPILILCTGFVAL